MVKNNRENTEEIQVPSIEELHKEIDLIQQCINRMANNSFLLKGWLVTIIVVILALSAEDVSPLVLGIMTLVPLVSFWFLDAYYLRFERAYVRLYNWVISERPKGNCEKQYDLNCKRFMIQMDKNNQPKLNRKHEEKRETIFSVMISTSQIVFYGIIFALDVLIIWANTTPETVQTVLNFIK